MTPPVNNLPTMKTALLLLAATVETTLGFSSLPQAKMSTELKSDKAGDPFRLVDVDIEHAKDCADHFGMCSTKELKQIKEDLHRKRIQDLVLGENAPEDVLSTKMIEEEISLQLNLLQNEMPPSTLFPPEDESPMAELPHKNESVELAEKVKHEEQVFWLEVLEEEGVLDSLAICALIGFLMFAPQLL